MGAVGSAALVGDHLAVFARVDRLAYALPGVIRCRPVSIVGFNSAPAKPVAAEAISRPGSEVANARSTNPPVRGRHRPAAQAAKPSGPARYPARYGMSM